MNIWNYIGEFLLFRWLFGKFKKSATEHGVHIENIGTPIDRNSKYLNDNHDGGIASIDGAATPVGDNFLGDSDNSADLDDLDIFMRNNKGYNHCRGCDDDYRSSSCHNNYNDWNSRSCSQSYDDFHDEQDDYDMMDDDF